MWLPMKKKLKLPAPTNIRFSPEDRRLIDAIAKKKGGNTTTVMREALRVLAAKEEVCSA